MSEKREILLFALVAELAQTRRIEALFEGHQTIAQLKAWLLARYPKLDRILDSCAYSIDHEIVMLDSPIGTGQQIAVLPPVSGG